MTLQTPKVSIGLPVYNGERYLSQALEAILAQTYPDFELLISDNASTDRTPEIVREYACTDSRIRYYRNEVNLGAANNFNRVFELARGTYFRWATADDLFAPDSLEQCIAVLDRCAEVVLCYPKTVLIDESGSPIRQYDDNLDLRFTSPVERFMSAMKQMGLLNVQYGLIRSSALEKTSLMGNYPGGDIPLILELTLYGQFWEISQSRFYRRMHSQALSSITTLDADQEFWDPKTKGRIFLRTWRHYSQYLRSILRAPLKSSERVELAYRILRSAIASRQTLVSELNNAVSQGLRTLFLTNRRHRAA